MPDEGVMRVKVIVTATGGIVGEGIMKCLKLANARKENRTYEIIAVDMNAQAPGIYRGDHGKLLPAPTSPAYIDNLVRLCKTNSVQAIFVGSDEELQILAKESERIERESGAIVITNSTDVLSTTKDKWNTYEFLKNENLPCPESALPEHKEEIVRQYGFPLIVKPREGHGSQHLYLVHDENELRFAISSIERNGLRPMIQEFLDAEDSEFTTGVVLNESGTRVISSISMRRVLKHGQTYKAFIEDFPDVRKIAEDTAVGLKAEGPVNVQSRVVDGESKIFEINPRFSASCPIRAVAGVNEPDIFFKSHVLGEVPKVDRIMNLVCLRFWNELYVPYSSFEVASSTGEISDGGAFVPDYF